MERAVPTLQPRDRPLPCIVRAGKISNASVSRSLARDRRDQFLERTMLSDDPALWPATVLLDGYKRRTISPVEAIRLALKRIADTNRELNAMNLVDEDG